MTSTNDFKSKLAPHVVRARAATATAARQAGAATRTAAVAVSGWPRGRVIGLSIALAIVLFLAVNVFVANTFRTARADLTDQSLFSLSNGTRDLLAKLDEPVHLRLFLSEQLLQSAPQLAAYAERVKAMLSTYAGLSDKITLEVIDPQPFSDDEDRAVGLGINRIRLQGANDELFFGLAATNSTTGKAEIPVFSPDREAFLEYDITRLVAELGQPQKPVIALIDGMAIAGQPMMQLPPQQITAQLRELYKVELLMGDVDALPQGTRVVMVVHPKDLSERTLFTLDQWVLSGGATMVFVDPLAETAPGMRPGVPPTMAISEFSKMLGAWGVGFDTTKAVGDPETAIRTVRNISGRNVEATNLPWLSVGRAGMAADDALLAQVNTLVLTTAGHFTKASDAVKLQPLLTASKQAGLLPAAEAGSPMADPRMMYTRLEKPADGKPLVLAARLGGELKTAFPDGKPKESPAPGEPIAASKAPANVILVADADMLMDRNWINTRQVMGQQVAQAFANNGAFVLNAIEQMVGGVALADLRGRGVSWRPFERIDALEKAAEAKYLAQQQTLMDKLRDTETAMAELSRKAGKDGEIVSAESEKAAEKFRSELLATRAELRNVQFELRRDVTSLQSWITLINVGFLPVLVAALALGFALRRPKQPLPQRDAAGTTAA